MRRMRLLQRLFHCRHIAFSSCRKLISMTLQTSGRLGASYRDTIPGLHLHCGDLIAVKVVAGSSALIIDIIACTFADDGWPNVHKLTLNNGLIIKGRLSKRSLPIIYLPVHSRSHSASNGIHLSLTAFYHAVFIGFIGASLGIAFGIGLAYLLSVIGASGGGVYIAPIFLPNELVQVWLMSLTVTILAGLFPAWKASRLSPLIAMRVYFPWSQLSIFYPLEKSETQSADYLCLAGV